MPRGDRTGPMGYGPRTGRGLGFCAGFPAPGYFQPGFGPYGYGRGRGAGYGRGLGYGPRYGRGFGRGVGFAPAYPSYGWQPVAPGTWDESQALKAESDYLKDQLDLIKERLSEIDEAFKSEKPGKEGKTERESEDNN